MEMSASSPDRPPQRTKREQTRQIAMIALGVLVVVFALLNFREVKINFIVATTRAPLIIVIVACLAVGLALGLLAGRKRDKG